MPKKLSTKKRTAVKDLPKKAKKLGRADMKKVKGGFFDIFTEVSLKPPKPPTTK